MARIGQLEVLANIRGQILDEERKAATIASQQAREKIVAEAEELAASTAWKQTGERYRALVDSGRNSQAHSGAAPGDRRTMERFRTARRSFDKARKVHRDEQDRKRAAAVAAKNALAEQAEVIGRLHRLAEHGGGISRPHGAVEEGRFRGQARR